MKFRDSSRGLFYFVPLRQEPVARDAPSSRVLRAQQTTVRSEQRAARPGPGTDPPDLTGPAPAGERLLRPPLRPRDQVPVRSMRGAVVHTASKRSRAVSVCWSRLLPRTCRLSTSFDRCPGVGALPASVVPAPGPSGAPLKLGCGSLSQEFPPRTKHRIPHPFPLRRTRRGRCGDRPRLRVSAARARPAGRACWAAGRGACWAPSGQHSDGREKLAFWATPEKLGHWACGTAPSLLKKMLGAGVHPLLPVR